MEEALNTALNAAGERLVEDVREALVRDGLCSELRVVREHNRVRILSTSRQVHRAEFGAAGTAPIGPMTGAARQAADEVVNTFRRNLREAVQ